MRKSCEDEICRCAQPVARQSGRCRQAGVIAPGYNESAAVALWATRSAAMNGFSWSRFAQRSGYSGFLLRFTFALSSAAFAEIQPSDCARAAKYSESKRGNAILVLQNGRTIFEHYANGGSASRRWPIFSGTKSFWGIAALAAVHDGLFELDDPVSDTITEWKNDPRKSQITVRQLLSQTDGIEGARVFSAPTIRDRNAMAIQLPMLAEPGTAFIYGPSHLQIFSELLRRKLRGRSVISYFEAHVANRLGLRSLKYKKDARGNPLPATGFELTAREWARLGELVIGNGNYHRTPNCAGKFVARSVCRFAGEPGVWPHVLVESAGTERT